MFWIITYIVSAIVAIGVLYHMSVNAPEGYQDKDGFHYGNKK